MPLEETQLPSRAIRAHAIKNCLAIVTAVNRLLEPVVGEVERQRLSRSQSAVQRLLELLEDDLRLHDGSSPRRGTGPVAAAHILGAVRGRVEDLARASGVRLSFRAGAGKLRGQVDELIEALLNVVMNAVGSTLPGGAVVVTSQASADGALLWTVEDDGPGIPKQVLARVGTPFVSGREGGSGLGVAVARDTVERHGGRLEIQSTAGSGTRVTIYLPQLVTGNTLSLGAQAPGGRAPAMGSGAIE